MAQTKQRNTLIIILVILIVCLAIAAIVAIAIAATRAGKCSGEKDSQTSGESGSVEPGKIEAGIQAAAREGKFKYGAVTSDNGACSQIGRDILGKFGGSATDAAIATTFCIGVVHPQHAGIGGGHFMTVYDTPRGNMTKVITTFISREVAPLAASEDMFSADPTKAKKGGLAVAVPAEVAGFYAEWQKFGRVDWAELVKPSIRLAKEGVIVSHTLESLAKKKESDIKADENLRSVFVKANGDLVKRGDVIKQPKLARSLEQIAEDPMSFYTGNLAQDILQDLSDYGSIITSADLSGYKIIEKEPLQVALKNGDYTAYSVRPPSSGAILLFILNILDELNLKPADLEPANIARTYHRMIETYKFGLGQRVYLGDEDFEDVAQVLASLTSDDFAKVTADKINMTHTQAPSYYTSEIDAREDHGTTQISVLAPGGGAVSVTSTVNNLFGATIRGSRTGIIFNNQLADVYIPGVSSGITASRSDSVAAGKKPMSSMSPAMILNKNGEVAMIIGGAGGKRIITGVALVTASNLWLGKSLKEAMDTARFHHQLAPNNLFVENDFDEGIWKELESYGHNIVPYNDSMCTVEPIRNLCSSCQGDSCQDAACIVAVGDGRRVGVPHGF